MCLDVTVECAVFVGLQSLISFTVMLRTLLVESYIRKTRQRDMLLEKFSSVASYSSQK